MDQNLWQVTRHGAISMQVCVEATADDATVLAFAEAANPCGTSHGWAIRRQGSEELRGAPELDA